MYTTWKWSIGEPYYKSERLQKNETLKEEEYDSQLKAINQSLSDDPFFQFVKNNKAAREMLIKPNEEFSIERVIEKALR